MNCSFFFTDWILTRFGSSVKKGHKAKKKLPPIVMNNRSPYFIVVVSAINLMLLIWELVLGGFEEPAANPMLGPPAYILIGTHIVDYTILL